LRRGPLCGAHPWATTGQAVGQVALGQIAKTSMQAALAGVEENPLNS
jgi:hypothetical protein